MIRMNCEYLKELKKSMTCLVVGTITNIETNYLWLACVKCNNKSKKHLVTEKDDDAVIVKKRNVYTCQNKKVSCGDTDVEYKFKIPIVVVSLTFWDRQVQSLIDKTAVKLKVAMKKAIFELSGDTSKYVIIPSQYKGGDI